MQNGHSNPDAPAERSFNRAAHERHMDDMALLSEICSGSRYALASFFDRYSSLVYSVAKRVLKDSGEAEDVMQETFIRLCQNPGAFTPGRGSLAGWLAVTARNRAIDMLRRRKPSDPVEIFTLPSPTNLAQDAELAFLLNKVETAMAALSDEQRAAVELPFFEGLSHAEIAQRTGDPLETVKTRICLALTAIRKALNVEQ
jgi:RNA polymerase sigma-70 factor, ECF subfamily